MTYCGVPAFQGGLWLSLPAYRDVDLALLVELVRRGAPLRPVDTYELVARHFPELSDEDRAKTRPDGRTKVFQNIIHWGRNHLNVRGLLAEATPGTWQTTADARTALIDDLGKRCGNRDGASSFVGSTRLLSDLLGPRWASVARLKEANSSKPSSTSSGSASLSLKEEPQRAAAPDIEIVRRGLIDRLALMDGTEFEQLVGRLLDSVGFRDTRVVGRTGDEGVDVIAYLYSPFVTAKVAVQVKRHGSNVGPKDISYLRDRWSKRSDRLLFVTTADFTTGAREVAAEPGEREVALVNGTQLTDIMIAHGLGVRKRPLISYELDDDYLSGTNG